MKNKRPQLYNNEQIYELHTAFSLIESIVVLRMDRENVACDISEDTRIDWLKKLNRRRNIAWDTLVLRLSFII